MIRPRIYVGLLLLAAACTPGHNTQTHVDSNATSTSVGLIEVTAFRGPITPVSREGMPNSAPLPNAKIRISGEGEMHDVVTDASGTASIAVKPGHYLAQALAFPNSYPRPSSKPNDFSIRAGDTVRLRFEYDTGIR